MATDNKLPRGIAGCPQAASRSASPTRVSKCRPRSPSPAWPTPEPGSESTRATGSAASGLTPPGAASSWTTMPNSGSASAYLRPRTEDDYRSALRVHILPAFGHRQLEEDHAERRPVLAGRRGQEEPVTSREVLPPAQLHLRHRPRGRAGGHDAVPDQGRGTGAQCGATDGDRGRSGRSHPGDRRSLLDSSPPRARCGLRWGEIAGLRRSDINLEERTVRWCRRSPSRVGALSLGRPRRRPG